MDTAAARRWWTAIQRRDPTFDGAFVYAVVTTGIYCRPSCPARRPLVRNVRYYPAPGAAEREGYRACKRCRPQGGARPDAGLALRACEYLRRHAGERRTLGDVARSLAVSRSHLQRIFVRALGISPRAYLAMLRLDRFKERAGRGVASALYAAGYGSSSRLYERARSRLGMTPATFSRGGSGMAIAYDLMDSPLGRALIAATPQGLCAVEFADTDAALVKGLRARFPKAVTRRDPALLRLAGGRLRAILGGTPADPAIPLDVRATAFQARVWAELRAIPAGSTRSYGEIARRLGRPGSARAVARACASNPVAVLIPCHRAVSADGTLAGYRWGVGRKKALLALESAAAAGRRSR